MDADFWLQRWREGLIGFHQSEINPFLQRHWQKLGLQGGERVFVPLCGKSKDMLWLRKQGHSVFGIELSELAVDSFFRENQLNPSQRHWAGLPCYEADNIALCQGDFFHLQEEHLSSVRAVYDRASLVALPPAMRTEYARHQARILPPGCEILLVSLEYPEHQMEGPPFSISDAEIEALYGQAFEIEHLESCDTLERNPRFREQGLSELRESCFRLRRR